MLLDSSDILVYQDETNPNIFTKTAPVIIKGKENVKFFFTHYGYLPAESLVYWGNDIGEYIKIIQKISQEVSKICTDVGLEEFKSRTQENPEQTKGLLEQMRRENPRFVDFSKPIQDGEKINIETSQCFNIVTSVQIVVPFVLQCFNEKNEAKFTQNYLLGIARDINTSMMYWVDIEKGLYRHRETNKFSEGVIKVGERNSLHKAYSELFGENFPEVKAYYN